MTRRLAAMVLAVIVISALFAAVIAPFDPAQQLDIVGLKNQRPSFQHLLGTDAYSRDILSRVLYGARTSLMVASLATLVATMLGVVWGAVAATGGARLAKPMMLAVDVVRSVPRMLLFLVAVALAGALTPPVLAILLGAAAWPASSRMVYSLVRDTASRSFVEAARSTGASSVRVFAKHIAPHLIGPLTASGALLLADILALEAGLSFLGLGVRPPGASWGGMVQEALPYLGSAWWTVAVPCACLVITVLSAATIADQLQKKGLRIETAVPVQ